VRTRPTASFASDCIKVNEQQVSIKLPKGPHSSDNAQDSWSWKFDAVLHNSSQETTYNEVVLPVVQSVLQGYNGTVMCYGQTGAGKTYTQLGGTASYEYRGVSPRAIAEIFNFVHDSPQYDATIGISYLEIYNDSLVDLLSTLPSEDPNDEPLALIEDADGTTHVKGLRVEKVTSEEKALQLLFEGETNRAVAKHALNSQSTRGHAVFTIYLQLRSRVESSERVVRCKLNLVDLAGSERVKKTGTSG
jgi:kinesin family protein 6/9